jgi:hypothetical protein
MKGFVHILSQSVASKQHTRDKIGVEQSPKRTVENNNLEMQDTVSNCNDDTRNDCNADGCSSSNSHSSEDADDDSEEDSDSNSDDECDDDDDDYDDDDEDSGDSCTTDSYSQSKKDDDISFCEYEQIKEYASEETRRVHIWRFVVIWSILGAGAVLSTVTFVILRNQEQNDLVEAVSFFHFLKVFLCDTLRFNFQVGNGFLSLMIYSFRSSTRSNAKWLTS